MIKKKSLLRQKVYTTKTCHCSGKVFEVASEAVALLESWMKAQLFNTTVDYDKVYYK